MRRFRTQSFQRPGAVSTYGEVAGFVLLVVPCATRGRAGARLAHASARAALRLARGGQEHDSYEPAMGETPESRYLICEPRSYASQQLQVRCSLEHLTRKHHYTLGMDHTNHTQLPPESLVR